MTAQRAWVATRKGLFEWARRDGRWSIEHLSFPGDPVSAVLAPDPQVAGRPMIAALNLGHFGVKCHASDDQGRHWREVAAPAFARKPADSPDPTDWSVRQVWTLAGFGDRIWAGTLPGALFESLDGGQSWTLNEALWTQPGRLEWFGGGYDVPGIHSILIDPRPAAGGRRLLVGISCGGVWTTADAGLSWGLSARGMRASYLPPEGSEDQNTQDPHRIVACSAAPDHLWCQHHDGIWRSTDAAASWQRIGAVPVSDFGFAVAVDPTDPQRAWFVPAASDQRRMPVDAALVVLRTDDGGASFRTLRAGLPQSHCYDLFYRHGLDVSSDGRTLMMGSTTGGLWVSEDAGERWLHLSSTLPPIHSVTLAPG
ncbi:MAG: exo-alpha-sialidase [Burkholderiaceae bacterium]|nr:exo-alpha-sialidase [Burkholderiaceae bacterium]